jgi:hypothetical protein
MSVGACVTVRDFAGSVDAFAELSAAFAAELPISAAAPRANTIASFFIIELQ